jgi:hypothetical protein
MPPKDWEKPKIVQRPRRKQRMAVSLALATERWTGRRKWTLPSPTSNSVVPVCFPYYLTRETANQRCRSSSLTILNSFS